VNEILIDTSFKTYTDANGGDPDSTSKTLIKYHKILWNKLLPNGTKFELTDKKSGTYLYHNSGLGEFDLGSDAITNSYRNHKNKQRLIIEITDDVAELFEIGSTIGAYIIFPRVKIENKFSINQARGINSLIDDRFDLTLECIRLFYQGQISPLYETLLRYENFFKLFEAFENYVNFFLLDDLINNKKQIKFYLPFDDFKSKPSFKNVEDYKTYKEKVIEFVNLRNDRIDRFVEQLKK
jgi:hypothetical protein